MLLNDISCEINKLTSHFNWKTRHVSNLELLDMSELLFDALDYSLFKRSLETTKIRETELVVTSIGRVSLFNRG